MITGGVGTGGTAAAVLGLAVLDSANPTALLVALLLVVRVAARGRSALLAGAAYCAGIAASVLVVGVVGLLALDAAVSALAGVPPVVVRGAELAAGAVLLALGALLPSAPRRRRSRPSLDRSAPAMVVLGAGVTLVELTTALPYLAALSLLAASPLGAAPRAALLIAYAGVTDPMITD